MNELGQLLREAREAKGASLAEAEAQTRIRQKFIAAMEAEEWSTLPNEVTTRGFLRKYAVYLGLDEEAVLRQFEGRARTTPPPSELAMPGEREVDYRPIEMDLAHVQRRSIPWGWIGAAVVVLALAAAALYIYFYQPNLISNLLALPRSLPDPAAVIALEPSPTPTATPEINRVTATPTATPAVAATPTPAPAVTLPEDDETPIVAASPTPEESDNTVVEQMALGLEVLARSWVRLVIDDRVVMEAVLEPGEQADWQANDSIVLRTGNANGVVIVLNGQVYDDLGGPGEVVEVQWRLVNGQVVRLTPTPSLPQPVATPTDTPAAEG